MKITKKQIKAIDNGNLQIRDLFPDVFEEKFTGWAKDDSLPNWMIFFKDDVFQYGFSGDGEWLDSTSVNPLEHEHYSDDSDNRPATDKEVKEALTKEAIKRGFVEGAIVKSITDGEVRQIKGSFFFPSNENSNGNRFRLCSRHKKYYGPHFFCRAP